MLLFLFVILLFEFLSVKLLCHNFNSQKLSSFVFVLFLSVLEPLVRFSQFVFYPTLRFEVEARDGYKFSFNPCWSFSLGSFGDCSDDVAVSCCNFFKYSFMLDEVPPFQFLPNPQSRVCFIIQSSSGSRGV